MSFACVKFALNELSGLTLGCHGLDFDEPSWVHEFSNKYSRRRRAMIAQVLPSCVPDRLSILTVNDNPSERHNVRSHQPAAAAEFSMHHDTTIHVDLDVHKDSMVAAYAKG